CSPDREGAAAVMGQAGRAPAVEVGGVEIDARAADPLERLAGRPRIDEPAAVRGEAEAVEAAAREDADMPGSGVDDGELGDAGEEPLAVGRPGLRVEGCRGQETVALAVARDEVDAVGAA